MATDSAIVLLVTGGFVGALGFLIKYFGAVRLIAGYDPDRVADEEGLADFIGTNTLYVAALVFLVAGVEYTDSFGGSDVVWIGFVVGVVGLAARMIVGARRYEESQ
ncbi:hypothetical protein C488_01914 [Natrinema pellirubrum DSM 15624]|uniref:DUF3784 domain-containing protein n=1 Tax=Natrinema pellirubrum (strain DSM 15624 / CIP 106293 / JCM 10476 / NCIMB 786 / 157) TaxID=797303 RepID=L0JL72_NATP1|nr:DUF3784 domain-containing protein [Natrinema pellirubrum]AGB31111.1 hypothetical protein Natpe_1205 [Natrinema pellirubrum DSM 15624]ELY81237.1 hypothetical protein C488_01914 [Natrinema pellirubrum DSM 15624]